MKKFILALVLVLPFRLAAQDRFVEVESSIDEVQLFLQGANVNRLASVPLKAGISTLIFQGITTKLDPNSIRVSASNQVVILAVTGKNAILMDPRREPIIRMLEDSLRLLSYELEEEKNILFVLDQQESLIMANKDLKGDKGLVLIDLEDALIIYQKQLGQIKKGQLECKTRQAALQSRIQKMQLELAEFKRNNQQPSYEIRVTVSVAANTPMESFRLNYFVYDAVWVPNYDIRVKDLNSPVVLKYKADVYNNTGENWNSVKLSLSSGNPSVGGTAPELYPQRLDFEDVEQKTPGIYRYKGVELNDNVRTMESKNNPGFAQQLTTFSFELPSRVKVIANNEALSLDMTSYDLKGIFEYFTVPKLAENAYLRTRITGWKDLNLLAGNANIYYEGTYLGRSVLDPYVAIDTLSVSLGMDKGVIVKREKLVDFCSSNFTGSKRKDVLAYEITLRNNKAQAVNLQVQDQIPLSNHQDISVEVTNISGAVLDEQSGLLSWYLTVQPGETVKLRIEFSVKYPKGRVVQVQ